MPKRWGLAQIKSGWETLSRLAKREINYYRTRPTNLVAFLTYGCTSHCRTCTIWNKGRLPGELSLKEWKNLVDQIAPLNIVNVELFGGEALLRPEVLFDLIEHISSYGIQKDVVTNCSLIDQATAEKLVESSLDKIYISVDGVGANHDRVRGVPGFFDKVKSGVEYLVKSRGSKKTPILICNCTISKWNVHSFDEVFDFAYGSGFDEVHFEYAGEFPPGSLEKSKIDGLIPSPHYVWQDSSILVSSEEAEILKQKIKQIKEKAKKIDKFHVSAKNIDVLDIKSLKNGIFPHKRCYVCRYLISIDPYGNVMGCPFFSNYFLGNIKTEKFSSIWNNAKHRKFIRMQAQGKLEMCRYCIISVERNPTFWESIAKAYMSFRSRYGE
ncbi:MAG: radical SAM protein [candidate division Zixibacteria bacterium]|nr:radical SAM protein [candidate division Zixibacteria bacterium]